MFFPLSPSQLTFTKGSQGWNTLTYFNDYFERIITGMDERQHFWRLFKRLEVLPLSENHKGKLFRSGKTDNGTGAFFVLNENLFEVNYDFSE